MEHNDNNNEKIVDVEYEDTKVVETNTSLSPYNSENTQKMPLKSNNPFKRMKGKTFKRAMSYVLVGIICSVLGGAASVGAMMYVVPNSSGFKNSDLYKTLSQNKTSNTKTSYQPTLISSTGQGLTVADIAKKVSPAVVGVSTKSITRGSYWSTAQVQEGAGSGVIFDSKGYIITNYHVIKGATQIHVILNNNKEVKAKEINHDEENDIAIIQITDKVDLPGIAELGDSSSVQVGEQVVAIGNPMGELLGSVTEGIISAVDRQISEGGVKFLQTDAAISPGNSGGPLINAKGQVIGINSEKLVSDGAEGLGFAIPINLVKSKISGLISSPIKNSSSNSDQSSQLLMGIGVQDIDEDTAASENLVVGVLIASVEEGSPAETAGMKPGDVIVKFDGQTVKTANELNALKNKHKVGDKVKVVVNRNGKEKELTVKFEE